MQLGRQIRTCKVADVDEAAHRRLELELVEQSKLEQNKPEPEPQQPEPQRSEPGLAPARA